MQKSNLIKALIITLTFFTLSSAYAHGVWLAKRTGEWALVLGGGADDDEYKPEAVKTAVALGDKNTPATVNIRAEKRNAILETGAETQALAVYFEDGYWTQDKQKKWHPQPKNKVEGAKKSGYYQMYTQAILSPDYQPNANAFSHQDFPLQIVAQKNPLTLKKGDALRVQVLFQGKPLPGVELAEDYIDDSHTSSRKTDAKGYVTLKIRSAGLNVIKVSHAVDRNDRTEADKDSYAATLAFSYPHTH